MSNAATRLRITAANGQTYVAENVKTWKFTPGQVTIWFATPGGDPKTRNGIKAVEEMSEDG